MSVWTIEQAVGKYGEDRRDWLSEPVAHFFQRYEIVCRCGCGLSSMYPLQLVNLDNLRRSINHPLLVTSGCRCQRHNAIVGGEINSMHLPDFHGMTHATDIVVPEYVMFQTMEDEMEEIWSFGGIGKYLKNGFIHWDTGIGRENFRRWEGD